MKESRLNKIRFYNLASLILDCHAFLRSLAMTKFFNCHYEGKARSNLLCGLLHWQHVRFSAVRNDNYFYSSLRGFAEAIYSIVNCFITFAHAVRLALCALATAMTIKNNLVKTFLTSINFDNLSERIKNLRLVINKFNFFTKEEIIL